MLTICYPYVAIEPIITKLSAQNWIDATKKKNLESDRDINLFNLQTVDAELAAVFKSTEIKMSEFLSLQVGDVITTDQKIVDPISLLVNRRAKFFARPGLSGKKRAIQITSEFDETA